MLKKFMIAKVDQEQLTETTGSIVFHLIDEEGYCRKVEGSTFLDENKKAQGVSTKLVRELPLIENLFSNRHNKHVEVEFDHFNKVFDRKSGKTVNQIAYDTVMQMLQKQTLLQKFSQLFRG